VVFFSSMNQANHLHLLNSIFGHKSFRGSQEKIVLHLYKGEDCLVLMPTSAGKSLCYQIPALMRDGVGIIISPLIALMKDQVDNLNEMGVRAKALNSSLPFKEVLEIQKELRRGDLDLLYIAPEKLANPSFFSFLKTLNIALFAIDEAHCISEWGHDFRPSYLQLGVLKDEFPGVPLIALTATADKQTRAEILEKLKIPEKNLFLSSFDRPNISYEIVEKKRPKEQLQAFLRENKGESGIVYCMSRKKVEELALWLSERGLKALPYHAGLDEKIRARNQNTFIKEEEIIMVATVAFGMGIDKPNVRFVAHMDLPKSIEAYYQETGRAGRDGLPSKAWMTYGLDSVVYLKKLMEGSEADNERKWVEKRKCDQLISYCETAKCRRERLLEYFDEPFKGPCKNCDNCWTTQESVDATLWSKMALSAVFRTGESFGVHHLVSLLRGENNEKVRQFNHQNLSVYGIGKMNSPFIWKALFRKLIAENYLLVDSESFGALSLSSKSGLILKENQKVFLKIKESTKKEKQPLGVVGGDPHKREVDFKDEFQKKLFDRLRAFRLKLSKERGVAPYNIFIDKTLMEMADKRPQTMKDFRSLNGVGNFKLRRYGKLFVDFLSESERLQ